MEWYWAASFDRNPGKDKSIKYITVWALSPIYIFHFIITCTVRHLILSVTVKLMCHSLGVWFTVIVHQSVQGICVILIAFLGSPVPSHYILCKTRLVVNWWILFTRLNLAISEHMYIRVEFFDCKSEDDNTRPVLYQKAQPWLWISAVDVYNHLNELSFFVLTLCCLIKMNSLCLWPVWSEALNPVFHCVSYSFVLGALACPQATCLVLISAMKIFFWWLPGMSQQTAALCVIRCSTTNWKRRVVLNALLMAAPEHLWLEWQTGVAMRPPFEQQVYV